MAYTPEEKNKIVDSICEDIQNGTALRKVLKKEGMPSSKTFFEWIDKDSEKVKQYARACEDRADLIFEEIFDIADNQESDVYVDGNGLEQTNHNVIQRARLRFDARKWAVSKLNPKKYGDKLDFTTNGKDITSVTRMIVDESTNKDA